MVNKVPFSETARHTIIRSIAAFFRGTPLTDLLRDAGKLLNDAEDDYRCFTVRSVAFLTSFHVERHFSFLKFEEVTEVGSGAAACQQKACTNDRGRANELTTRAVRIHFGPPYTWSTAFLAYPNERISFSLHRAGSRIGYRITIVHTIPPSIFTVSIAALA